MGRDVILVLPVSGTKDEENLELRSGWLLDGNERPRGMQILGRWRRSAETQRLDRDVVVFRGPRDEGFPFVPVPSVLTSVVACKGEHARADAAAHAVYEHTKTEVARVTCRRRMSQCCFVSRGIMDVDVVVACPSAPTESAATAAALYEWGIQLRSSMCTMAQYTAPVQVIFAGASEGSPFVRGMLSG